MPKNRTGNYAANSGRFKAPARKLFGKRFGRLTVIGSGVQPMVRGGENTSGWLCRCDCAKERVVAWTDLRRGTVKSCGNHVMTHGMTGTAMHNIWGLMLSRCNNPNDTGWPNYGARGIKVCERWLKFENFYSDMAPRPTPDHSLDRKDNNGNYEPGNCQWSTQKEQGRNTRKNRVVTFAGLSMCCNAWDEYLGKCKGTTNKKARNGLHPFTKKDELTIQQKTK